jgi:hypothetical protein
MGRVTGNSFNRGLAAMPAQERSPSIDAHSDGDQF